jgi:septum formation protein
LQLFSFFVVVEGVHRFTGERVEGDHVEDGKTKTFYEETKVTFYEISDEQIDHYIKTGEPMDKAGSYGIQGKAAVFIKGIEGDYYNVVGFPIARFLQEITK